MFYRLTPGLVLRSPWRPHRARLGERVLTVRGGGVLPPGHPSSGLALELLTEAVAAVGGVRLLDVGCGSGLLLLAGMALGARSGVGVDLSGRAVRVSRENASRNGLCPALRLIQGSTECLRGPFEVIAANLPFGVQLTKTAEFSRLAAPGACLILAGFKDTQEAELWSGFQESGWTLRRRLSRDEWVADLPPEKSFTWVAWLLTAPPA